MYCDLPRHHSLLQVNACATLDAGFLPKKFEMKLPASTSFGRSIPYNKKDTKFQYEEPTTLRHNSQFQFPFPQLTVSTHSFNSHSHNSQFQFPFPQLTVSIPIPTTHSFNSHSIEHVNNILCCHVTRCSRGIGTSSQPSHRGIYH